MFKTLKKLMGLSYPLSDNPEHGIEKNAAKQKIKNAEKVTTVTVTPKKTKTVTKGETKASLGKMTKKDIDDLAKEKFGVELVLMLSYFAEEFVCKLHRTSKCYCHSLQYKSEIYRLLKIHITMFKQ